MYFCWEDKAARRCQHYTMYDYPLSPVTLFPCVSEGGVLIRERGWRGGGGGGAICWLIDLFSFSVSLLVFLWDAVWLVVWLDGWLVGWLVGRLTGWLVGWLVS